MSEPMRALVVLLGLTLPCFWLARAPLTALAMRDEDYRRRALLWVGLLVAAYLSHSYWLYGPVMVVALLVARRDEPQPLAMFMLLLFVIPPFPARIAGFAGLQQLIELTHPRLLSALLLGPAWWVLRCDPRSEPFGSALADKCLLGFLLLQLAVQLAGDTLTNTLRFAVYAFTDAFLPYYVASRALRDLPAARDIVASFVFAVALLAPIAAFEFVKHWLLYSSLPDHMQVGPWGMGNYLSRDGSLRALASTGHSLVLGYLMVIAIALYPFVRRSLPAGGQRLLVAALAVGIAAPVSRGPWVGACAALLVLLLTGPDKLRRAGRGAALLLVVVGVLMATPLADRLIALMPFVGEVDDFNVTYRQRLFDASLAVIAYNPWLGSSDFLAAPEMQQMIQGEGIIDVVNSYLGVALAYGLVGLALFCGVFAGGIARVLYGLVRLPAGHEAHDLGRGLLAALVGVLVTIATVSSINNIPLVYWLLAGLATGYGALVRRAAASLPRGAASRPVLRRTPVSSF